MEPLPPLPGKGLASVTKWRRSQNEKGEEERRKKKKGEKEKRKREKRENGRERTRKKENGGRNSRFTQLHNGNVVVAGRRIGTTRTDITELEMPKQPMREVKRPG